MRLLLDTHVFIWLLQGDPIPPRVQSEVGDLSNELFLSLVTPWEMQLKAGVGKLSLGGSVIAVTQAQVRQSAMKFLPVTLDHVDALSRLPDHHRDPFDRLLVAQAIHEGLTLVTADAVIARYPVATLWR